MIRQFAKGAAICLAMSLLHSPARAEFVLEGSATPKSAPTLPQAVIATPLPNNQTPQVLTESNPGANAQGAPASMSPGRQALLINSMHEKLTGGAKYPFPLGIALKQILPPAAVVTLDADINPNMPVGWIGGQSRQDVLNAMLGEYGLQITSSPGKWDDLRIGRKAAVMSAPPTAVVSSPYQSAPAPSPVRATPIMSAGKEPVEVDTRPEPPKLTSDILWHVDLDSDLRQTLKDWGKQAGWSVDWKDSAKNRYFTQSGDIRANTFEAAADTLLKLYTQKPFPLRAHFHGGNKSLEVYGATDSAGNE